MIEVRTLRASDDFPEGLNTGFERMPVIKNWCWVAEEHGETAGVLLAAPMHGIVYLMRLCVRDGAPPSTSFLLLRACMRDALKRGCKGYLMHVDPTSPVERKMIPIVRRARGTQLTRPQIQLIGWVEQAAAF